MLRIGNKEYRNLEEQVKKNQEDIQHLLNEGGTLSQFGIKVIGQVDSASQLPNATEYQGEFGDAFAVGTSTPYDLYIFTRAFSDQVNPQWFNIGPFPVPSTIPGPVGPEGAPGEDGKNSLWYVGNSEPNPIDSKYQPNDMYLDSSNGNVYTYTEERDWQYSGNIKGPQGIQGIRGVQGPPGIGLPGPQGERGPKGDVIHFVGQLTNINQLPDPNTIEDKSSAYLVLQTTGVNRVYVIIGEGTNENPYIWVNAGTFGAGSIIRTNGTIQPEVDIDYYVNQNTVEYTQRDTIKRNLAYPNGVDPNFIDFNLGSQQLTNLNGRAITLLRTVRLGITDSDTIIRKAIDISGLGSYHLQFDLNDETKNKINNAIVNNKTPNIIFGTDNLGSLKNYSVSPNVEASAIVQRSITGAIQVPQVPTSELEATSKKYVDDTEDLLRAEIETLEDAYLPKDGSRVMTGTLTLPNMIITNLVQDSNPKRMLTLYGSTGQGFVMWSDVPQLYRYDIVFTGEGVDRNNEYAEYQVNATILLNKDINVSNANMDLLKQLLTEGKYTQATVAMTYLPVAGKLYVDAWPNAVPSTMYLNSENIICILYSQASENPNMPPLNNLKCTNTTNYKVYITKNKIL